MTSNATSGSPAAQNALRGISSMATRQLLGELVTLYGDHGVAVQIESMGGVDAARRVAADEPWDLVVLASDAIDRLMDAGKLVAGTRVDLVVSGVSMAVPEGRDLPDVSSEASLRAAVVSAGRIGYSTGPSGVALLRLFERWGVTGALGDRLMQAPPGVPVASLVARGEVDLGFQQLSELLHVPGITLVGPMPAEVAIDTIFSAAVAARCTDTRRRQAARDFIDFMASSACDEAKRRQGMTPA
ncbi:MAG: substrate-binding domain-containing protein [Burkholderiaceae bacterium]